MCTCPHDITTLRDALAEAGFRSLSQYQVWNNLRPDRKTRMLKVPLADEIAKATNKQKWALVNAVRKHFGGRLIKCGLYETYEWHGRGGGREPAGPGFRVIIKA